MIDRQRVLEWLEHPVTREFVENLKDEFDYLEAERAHIFHPGDAAKTYQAITENLIEAGVYQTLVENLESLRLQSEAEGEFKWNHPFGVQGSGQARSH